MFASSHSTWCAPRHPQKITGPPSPSSSSFSVAAFVTVLFLWCIPRLPVCVLPCSPSSSGPSSPCHLFATEVPHHRRLSSPSLIVIAPPFSTLSGRPKVPVMFLVPSPTSCVPSFSSGVVVSPKPPRTHTSFSTAVAVVTASSLLLLRHCSQSFISSLGFHFARHRTLPHNCLLSPSSVSAATSFLYLSFCSLSLSLCLSTKWATFFSLLSLCFFLSLSSRSHLSISLSLTSGLHLSVSISIYFSSF